MLDDENLEKQGLRNTIRRQEAYNVRICIGRNQKK